MTQTVKTRMNMAVIQPSTQIDQEQFNSRFTSNNSIQQNISQVPYTYDGSSFINQRDSFQHHQATSSVVCPQPMNNYSAQQPINDINPTAISRNAAINLTGNISTQSKWCKPNNYIDNNQEYASLNSSTYGSGNPSDNAQTTASGARQTQTDGYYNQDPNRSLYLNVANISTAASSTATPADTSSYQNYHVQNKPANWSLATTNDPSVCNNHGYYEIQNQQENIHDKLVYYHQQPQPNQSHQYPPEHYTDTSKFPSYATTNNYEHYFAHNHHAQGQHNVNFDTSRSYYYGGSSCSTEHLDDNSLQHPHLWAQSSQHHPQSSEIDMRAQVSKGEHSNSASQDASRVQEINQSWMSESQQQYATEENGDDQNNKQQETRFKNSISTVSNSCSGKQSFNDNGSIQKTNQCGVCGRNYARPSTLKTHLRTHTNERPFKCNVCLKTFSQAANLTAHQRVHTGERPFSCPICGRQFSQSSSVITHLRTHSGERPYRCSMCSRTFSDSSTLTKHCRIHSGEKPYQCDYCPLNFSQSGNLSRHLKLHLISTSSNSSGSNSLSATTSSQPSINQSDVYKKSHITSATIRDT